jgi:acetoin utilization protein AcuB
VKVETIMTRDVVSISPDTTVSDALDLLDEQSIRHLPVLEGERLVGLVSDRDLAGHILPLRAAIAHPDEAKSRLETPVSELLRSDVITVVASDDVSQAIDAMLVFGVGAVPVADEGRLLGIVTTIDVLQAARTAL